MDLKAQVSYLKGLAEGFGISEQEKEGKILIKIIDLLDNLVDEFQELQDDHDELCEYTEAIDDDLTELEESCFDQDDDDDEDELNSQDDEERDYDEGFTIECPNCREMVVVGGDLLDDDSPLEVTCPNCGEVVLIDDEDWDENDLEEPEDAGKEKDQD